jgi:hypothetical protein
MSGFQFGCSQAETGSFDARSSAIAVLGGGAEPLVAQTTAPPMGMPSRTASRRLPSDAGLFILGALPRPLSRPHPWAGQVSQVPTFYRVLLLLSVKTHWQVVTGNTKSWEAAGALAGTGPSVNGPDPGTR